MDLKELFTKEFSQKPLFGIGVTTEGIIQFLNGLVEAGPEAYDTIREALKTAEGVSVLSEITRIAKEGHVKAINLLKLLEEKGLAERVYEKYLIAKAKEGLVSTASLGKTLLSKKELAGRLLVLPPNVRAMVIAGSYEERLKDIPAEYIDDERERVARQMEEILDEMPDRDSKATQRALRESAKDVLNNMIRGNAGDISSVVFQGIVTAEMIEDLFLEDPEIKSVTDPASGPRILRLLWTLVMGKTKKLPALERFLKSDTGREVIKQIADMSSEGDEDASELFRNFEDILHITHEDEEKVEFLFSDDEVIEPDEDEEENHEEDSIYQNFDDSEDDEVLVDETEINEDKEEEKE